MNPSVNEGTTILENSYGSTYELEKSFTIEEAIEFKLTGKIS